MLQKFLEVVFFSVMINFALGYKSNYEKYVILSNIPETVFSQGKKTWSVNTQTSIFYKKQSIDEIKEEYELEIEELKDQIKFLKKEIKKLKVKKG